MAMTEPKVEEIFSAALRKEPGAERTAFLDGACGRDAAFRARVDALLKAHESAGSFLESPAAPVAEGPGARIGPYKLLQRIGEGGMGVVYMAEQEEPVRRKVALKIIKLGMDTKQVIARFEAERQALALMDHVNIARVLDAGATDTGRPYFVMELVKGPQPDDTGAPRALPARLRGRAARPPEGHHPPRPEVDQRHGDAPRRPAGAESDRLRHRQGDEPAPDGEDALHRVPRAHRHPGVHEPGAGRDERPRRRHADGHLLPRRTPVRAVDRLDAVRPEDAA
jgi:hypothetical protein